MHFSHCNLKRGSEADKYYGVNKEFNIHFLTSVQPELLHNDILVGCQQRYRV
jgi:hypothetical protein